MVVAVENGLDNIKNHLKNSGYKVVDAEGYRGAVDAYVYENAGFSLAGEYNFLTQNSSYSNEILIVNAKNKSPQEVLSILINRVYGENINFL